MIRLFILFVIFASITFILYQIVQFAIAIGNTKGRLRRDLQKLKSKLVQNKAALVPATHEEIGLLSVDRVDECSENGFNPITTGSLSTVYHENIFSYAFKIYRNTDRSILLLSSFDYEIGYIMDGKSIEVYYDKELYGYITDAMQLVTKTGEKRAEITVDKIISTNKCIIKGKEVAEVINPLKIDGPTNRMFLFLKELESRELKDLLALSLYFFFSES